jgi:hypothetical protein
MTMASSTKPKREEKEKTERENQERRRKREKQWRALRTRPLEDKVCFKKKPPLMIKKLLNMFIQKSSRSLSLLSKPLVGFKKKLKRLAHMASLLFHQGTN